MSESNSNEPPTKKQLNYLKILNYDGNPPETSNAASLEIADLRHHWKSKDPSGGQISYLNLLGYTGAPPETRGEAADLITKLIEEKNKKSKTKTKLSEDKIPLVIYSKHWSEENPFAHREHGEKFYAAKEWRESLDN